MQASEEFSDADDSCFIRTEDIVCMMCTSGDSTRRHYLAAEGFGSQMCHLELDSSLDQKPCELQKCVFKLEDAMSVHAMYTSGLSSNKHPSSCKILMYGHAILLRHLGTKELLCSLTTSPENDKMAYNVGFDQLFEADDSVEERCWFRILPASNQRSEGEKVRAGDDIFLVNVANERYLFAQMANLQNAESELSTSKHHSSVCVSFYQCVWSLHIVCSGSAKEAAIGNVNGGDVVRFIHRFWGGGDALVVRAQRTAREMTETFPGNIDIQYEKSASESHELQSLWRVELFQMKFGGGFTSWGQAFRLRHLITGKFLGIELDQGDCERTLATSGGGNKGKHKTNQLLLLSSSKASQEASAFCFVNSTTKSQQRTKMTYTVGMGAPEIHFGDSEVYLLHIYSKKYLGCSISEPRHRLQKDARKAVMQPDFHQTFAFTMTRASPEQAKAASIMQLSQSVMNNYMQKVLHSQGPPGGNHLENNLCNVLAALIQYFRAPDKDDISHDQYQQLACALKERQHLFRKQGMLRFTLTTIIETANKVSKEIQTSQGNYRTKGILHSLYELLAAMIRGNHKNCSEFATKRCLRVFLKQLALPDLTHEVLMVIQCLLTDSPEVLNLLSKEDIGIIVNLLNTNGRDSEVMKLLSSLCVCHGVAMRDKQQLIYKHLLNCNDLLVQTSLHTKVYSLHSDLCVGQREGSASYRKWYYEVQVSQFHAPSSPTSATNPWKIPHLRVGWAHTNLYKPQPCSNGTDTLCGGLGDNVFSVGYDGSQFWMGGTSITINDEPPATPSHLRHLQRQRELSVSPTPSHYEDGMPICRGDVIGCCVDLGEQKVWFTKNGKIVNGCIKLFDECCDLLTPSVSFSSGVSVVIALGGTLGDFRHAPPPLYAGVYEAAEPGKEITLIPFHCVGDEIDIVVSGPTVLSDFESFLPCPIDTSKIVLPDSIMSAEGNIRDLLAKNIHEIWSKNKIDSGFSYAPVRNDDLKHNPCLKEFEALSELERSYDYKLALSTLEALVTLGYQISEDEEKTQRIKFQELPPEKYRLSNGYTPNPLDLDTIALPDGLKGLVDQLAENAHNIWASSRIREGWTYGKANDVNSKRNPQLIPYSKLDAISKKANYDVALETVRTICGLGCALIPPTSGYEDFDQLMREFSESSTKTRTFRGQKCYKVTTGKWYYEVKVLTEGMMRIGWATLSVEAGKLLGSNEHSYAYDGYLSRKWHCESDGFGRRWKAGDVVGCMLDIEAKTICFSLNGACLYDSLDSSIAFFNIDTSEGFLPAITLSAGERAQINFGLKLVYFENEGYKPLCSHSTLQYNIPLWYSYHGGFRSLREPRHQKSSNLMVHRTSCSLKVQARDWDYTMQSEQEVLRLNMGFTVNWYQISPLTPTLVPHPRILSSLPLTKSANFSLENVFAKRPDYRPISFSVVFPAGQVPSAVFLGWTTPSFQYVPSQFSTREKEGVDIGYAIPAGHAGVRWSQSLEAYSDLVVQGSAEAVSSIKTAFMVCLCDLLPKHATQLVIPIKVHCTLDMASGKMTFSCDRQDFLHISSITAGNNNNLRTIDHKEFTIELAVSHGTKLFPTVVITPSTEVLMTLDLTPKENCRPLSSTFISSTSLKDPASKAGGVESSIPLCPRRLELMVHFQSQWVRQVPQSPKYITGRAAGGRGALILSTDKEVEQSVSITLPQEDIVMDLVEISEDFKLLDFHIQTLDTLCSVCSHRNLSLAQSIMTFIDSEHLLRCLQEGGIRFELSAAYLKLVSYLHLNHQIQTRLLLRGEFIIPRSECTKRIELFKPESGPTAHTERCGSRHQEHSLSTIIQHNISSSFSEVKCVSSFPLASLREVVLDRFELLLTGEFYKMQLLPTNTVSNMFVPLIESLDMLLVIGALKGEVDFQRLLHILDPLLFPFRSSEKQFDKGLLSDEVSSEEPMKLALCVLLHHLCDCQVRHRVECVVSFSNGYVDKMRLEQLNRYTKDFQNKPKEFRSSTEIQVEAMLALHSQHSCSENLRSQLKSFNDELKRHCGSDLADSMQQGKDLSIREKVKRMVGVLSSFNSSQDDDCHGDAAGGDQGGDRHCTSLRQVITQTLVRWASVEIRSLKLVGELFSLLYRQFNEVGEVVQALGKTYVLEVTKDPKTDKPNFDIPGFCYALGSLRLLLSVSLGQEEEELLKDSLRFIRRSDLFYCHPNLMHRLGVYSTVLKLMTTYLGISSGSVSQHLVANRSRLALDLYNENNPPMPVENCCKFLCKFAKINRENQRALFKHMYSLLEYAEKYPGLLTCSACTPLDVATATIKDNRELALALDESYLELVVQLLVATTINVAGQGSLSSSFDDASFKQSSTLRHNSSFSFDWTPGGGSKCLEFLQTAVWVDTDQIQENAHVIVQQLIHHSECLGPALSADALGLHHIYWEVFQKIASSEASLVAESNGYGHRESSTTSTFFNRQYTIQFNWSNHPAMDILVFYTSLVRLLAYCASKSTSNTTKDRGREGRDGNVGLLASCATFDSNSRQDEDSCSMSRHKHSVISRTRNILQNLIKVEDIVGILSLAFDVKNDHGLRPCHKEAVLLFLDRVYGITSPELLLKLLCQAFLPDVKCALKLAQEREDMLLSPSLHRDESSLSASLNRYICYSMIPLLCRFSCVFKQLKKLKTQLHVIDNFLMCCFHLFHIARLSSMQLEEVSSFFVAIMKELHPKALQRFMPKIIASLQNSQPHIIVSYKLLASHYEYFSRYYQSMGVLDKTSLGVPSEEEKMCSALFVYRLLDLLQVKLPSDAHLLRAAVSCLKSVSQALYPSCLIPSQDVLCSTYNNSGMTYEPNPRDTSKAQLTTDLEELVEKFADYQHSDWVFSKHGEGWTYGSIYKEELKRNPLIRPYQNLPEQNKDDLRRPISEAISYLVVKGWNLSKLCPMDHNIPNKPRVVCIRMPVRSKQLPTFDEECSCYEPEVMDLSKVEIKIELLVHSFLTVLVPENSKRSNALQLLMFLKRRSLPCHMPHVEGFCKTTTKEQKINENKNEVDHNPLDDPLPLNHIHQNGNKDLAEQMAEHSHDCRAKNMQTDPNYQKHPYYVPFDLLDESNKEVLRAASLELLRFMRLEGFEPNKMRASLLSRSPSEKGFRTNQHQKFALQFFEKFSMFLCSTPKCDVDFYLKVLFPAATNYLQKHTGYFLPSTSMQASSSTASKEDKLAIIKVAEFTHKNKDLLFPSVKPPSAADVSPSSPVAGWEGSQLVDIDKSSATAKCILVLLQSIVGNMDVRVMQDMKESSELGIKMRNYFQLAANNTNDTSKHISKMGVLDSQLHFCLHLLVPTLTCIFKHVGNNQVGHILLQGFIKSHCYDIFIKLMEMALKQGPIYAGSSPLITIGQCLGAFALAYPKLFLHDKRFDFNVDSLSDELEKSIVEGTSKGNVLFVVDAVIPVLTSYIAKWWDSLDLHLGLQRSCLNKESTVSKGDRILGTILTLLARNFGKEKVTWFGRVVDGSVILASRCSKNLLSSHLVPMMEEMKDRAIEMCKEENMISSSWNRQFRPHEARYDIQKRMTEAYRVFVRDLSSLLPFISVFLCSHNKELQDSCCPCTSQDEELCDAIKVLFVALSEIFHCWHSSQYFQREFQNSRHQLAKQTKYHLTMKTSGDSLSRTSVYKQAQIPDHHRNQQVRPPNFILLCLDLLLPVYDSLVSKDDKPLLDMCTAKLGMKGINDEDLKDDMINRFRLRELTSQKLTHKFVRRLSKPFIASQMEKEHRYEERALRILCLAKIKNKIQQADKAQVAKTRWKQVLSQRKRKAVVSCFLAVPFFKLAPHRAINLFLQVYCYEWLRGSEQTTHRLLTEELLDRQNYLAIQRNRELETSFSGRYPQQQQQQYLQTEVLMFEKIMHMDPLSQLFKMVQRVATAGGRVDEVLYTSYANFLAKTIIGQHEDEDTIIEDNATGAYEEYTAKKAELVARQMQLADRGAPITVLNVITASIGEAPSMLHSTLLLGIALLKEGNKRVQDEMLHELNTMDVGFLASISKLLSSCSVLDWSAYERFNKSEIVQTAHTEVMCKVLPEYTVTISLFRFLQLLCEGHNLSFQNYLRTQAGNTTTVNIIVRTVDYLLRLQESISDFYWHYTDYLTIDLSGRENFLKAFKVAKQVFRTLTEYIQGPCVKNQDALAHSRLWDAVSGFIHIFAVLQRKLYRDTSQLELLRELLSLQEEMFILLLSMLEGSAMSSMIGKLMMDMLTESSNYIDDIMSFFSIFVKLKDSATSKAFHEYDLNKDGMISYLEFEKAMNAQQKYTKDEITYLMECADLNKDGLLDYMEFTERFHQPAENIGFHLCVLIVHLTDHLPNDKRIDRLKRATSSQELLEHFERNMGCIEILGKSGRIERVYFEVKATRLKQWEEEQIKASRRSFLHTVEMGSQKNKLKGFMRFCDETIFEMNYADKISGSAQSVMKEKALQHRRQHNRMLIEKQPFISRVKAKMSAFGSEHSSLMACLLWLQILWGFMLRIWPPVRNAIHKIWRMLPVLFRFLKTVRGLLARDQLASSQLPKTSAKRPPNLIIAQQQKKQLSRTVTTKAPSQATNGLHSENVVRKLSSPMDSGLLRKRTGMSVANGSGECRRSSMDDERRRSFQLGNYERRPSKTGTISLTYDRLCMRKPSVCVVSESPTPMEENLVICVEDSYIPRIAEHTKSWPSFMARNYFRLNNMKLLNTFLINIILLMFQVTFSDPTEPMESGSIDLVELTWTPVILKMAACIHVILSALLLVSYCYLKIPLVIFKREKHIARQLETNHLWISGKPLECWSDYWDQIVVPAHTFPRNYWDKRVKQRINTCSDIVDKPQITRLLGLEVKSKFESWTKMETIVETIHSMMDIRYCIWTVGVALSNPVSLYHMLYCGLSFIGLNWNYFYFSIHLLDFVMNFKLLRTVLKSVLHNGKQLTMTVLMTCVVIYIYTVIAFNFFRKFYRFQNANGEDVFKCNSMFQCFIFHIDQGLRSGGGIADKLESASGDPNETFRLFFDITFFFFVIIILLAIIQGLIIDAFGELRDKEETLTNEMLTKCFVCGLPKSEFDHIPHGFDNHVNREHNMAHYMFFLMYLIKKKESEFSGQESYVWEKYLQQSIDFFPLGDCFRSQEERTMAAARVSAEGHSQKGNQALRKHKAGAANSPLKKSFTIL